MTKRWTEKKNWSQERLGESINPGMLRWVTIVATLGFSIGLSMHTITRDSPLYEMLVGFIISRAP